jgi:hypothetical protein
MTGSSPVKSFETLDVQVKALEGDVRDIKTSITNLGAEVRSALSAVTTQFAQQQRTPWVAIGSIGALIIAVLSFIGSQALNPLQADIKSLKDEVVPRVEHNYRQAATDHLFDETTKRIDQIQSRLYDERSKLIDRLENENRELKRK